MLRSAGLVGAITLHGLRHTYASLMLEQKVHPKVVSEQLGHSSVGITLDLYSHLVPGLQEAAAKAVENAVNEALTDSMPDKSKTGSPNDPE